MRFTIRAFLVAMVLLAVAFTALIAAKRQLVIRKIEADVRLKLHLAFLALRSSEHRWETRPLAANQYDAQGNPIFSWRYFTGSQISSYQGPVSVAARWNDTANSGMLTEAFYPFCYPAAVREPERQLDTIVFAVEGDGAAFDRSTPRKLFELPNDTIILMEAARSGVHWMQPGDYELCNLLACERSLADCVKSIVEGRVNVLFADGEVWCLSGGTPMEIVKPFLTVDEAKTHSRDDALVKFRIGDSHTYDPAQVNRHR